jgi:carbonic anhydrase/acetyltransferase-like protein (isoleucine patch superfamily)
MDLVKVDGKEPCVHPGAYVDPKATLMGDVVVEEGAGIWPGAVIRGDDARVMIKKGGMVLENAVIEAAKGRSVTIGEKVIVSHGAIVHGANIGAGAIVGIGAIVLDEAVVGEGAIIGSAALVPPKKEIPAGKLVLGIPGKIVKDLTPDSLAESAEEWALLSKKVVKYIAIRCPGHM